MNKFHRIVTGTILLTVFGFMMFALSYGKPASPLTQANGDSVKAVKLRFTFASGDSANVTELEGGTIKVEKDGEKLAITPYRRDHGQVELRIFRAAQRDGREMMEALDTLLVDKSLTKLSRGNLPFSVQVIDAEKKLPAVEVANASDCCATTCNGTVVCGFCVCTDCGRCGPRWCECASP
ncbi:MAG TPA: hypothetical protein VFR51_05290 [Pyrinomonadaceae bacterium]|nr:hypothetical protein [Pyrinomonadaceae bacterium]